MSQAAEPTFFIAWKGANFGPFKLAQIKEKLASGEVSRMHQIQAGGHWLSLDEFLAKHEASEDQATKTREAQAKAEEVQMRQEYEGRLAAEREQQQALAEQLEAAERRARLLPPEALAPPPSDVSMQPIVQPQAFQPTLHYMPAQSAIQTSRTSGFAITAFIFALCNFVPFLNFVSWVLAIVFGHVALRDINHNPALAGRGLAIAALCITYFLLIIGVIFGILMAMDGRVRF